MFKSGNLVKIADVYYRFTNMYVYILTPAGYCSAGQVEIKHDDVLMFVRDYRDNSEWGIYLAGEQLVVYLKKFFVRIEP